MLSWSTKRRLIYLGGAFVVLFLLGTIVFFKLSYRSPTCSDGTKNGDESGIDCGGSCKNLCSSDNLTPVVLWSKVFNVSGDVYSAVAYIENPNVNYKNENAGYEFRILDSDNNLIIVKDGETSIPKNKKFAVFETGIVIRNTKPKSAEFKFTSFSPWEKDEQKSPDLSVHYSALMSTSTAPRIEGTISNNSLSSVSSLELDVFILDSKENVIAAGRTFIDNLLSRSQQDFVFTWPKPFDLGVESCTNPLDIAILIDRSGSMKSESINPPEPFNTVKSTAIDFIKNLGDNDQISIFSFGNYARKESSLSKDKQSAVSAITNLVLSATTSEQTNVTAGLMDAYDELFSTRSKVDNKKVLILISDGVPTEPKKENFPDYPKSSAISTARNISASGMKIYTIGLGGSISEEFLKEIATNDSYYLFAPKKEVLSSTYNYIISNICTRKPNVINVIYRAL